MATLAITYIFLLVPSGIPYSSFIFFKKKFFENFIHAYNGSLAFNG